MRKRAVSFLLVLLFSLQTMPFVFAENNVQVQVNNSSKQVTIQGNVTDSQQVTVYVTDSAGEVDYIDQTTSDSNGNFQFTYISKSREGTFTVTVGGSSINTPIKTSFALHSPDDPFTSDGTSSTGNVVKLDVEASNITKEKGSDGVEVTKVTVPSDKLSSALTQAKDKAKDGKPIVAVEIKDSPAVKVELPADVLVTTAKDAPNSVISVVGQTSSYDFAMKSVNITELSQKLGVEPKFVRIVVSIQKVSESVSSKIQSASNQSGTKLITHPVDFTVTAEGNGKNQDITTLDTYVSRTIDLPSGANISNLTGVTFNPVTGEQQFVPTLFKTVDNKLQAIIKRKSNSVYGVIEYTKSFKDVQNHWAKPDIEILASKLIVKGASATEFAPEAKITRAEFAALLVRSLGLTEAAAVAKFTDVKSGDWYAGVIGAAVQAGLVSGFENNTFKPNDNITREQMAIMIAAALKQADKQQQVSDNQDSLLAKFKDKTTISSWAQNSVAQSIQAGIIQGMTESTFVPEAPATRAQAVVMLKRLLLFAEFIN